jgi:hypothetical protein
LALTSPTSGSRSVGIVRSRTQATEFVVCLFIIIIIIISDSDAFKGLKHLRPSKFVEVDNILGFVTYIYGCVDIFGPVLEQV